MISINGNYGSVLPPQYPPFKGLGAESGTIVPEAGAKQPPPAPRAPAEPAALAKLRKPPLTAPPESRDQMAGIAALGVSFVKLIVGLGHRLKLRSLLPPPEPKPADRKEAPKAIDDQEVPAPTVAAMVPPVPEAAKTGQRRDDDRRQRPQYTIQKAGK